MAEVVKTRKRKQPSYCDREDDEDLELSEGVAADEDEELPQQPQPQPQPQPASKSEDFCEICKSGGKVLCCDSCTCVYHLECLDPPMKYVPKGCWRCPKCEDPLADIEKILDCGMRSCKTHDEEDDEDDDEEEEEEKVKHYLVKWKSRSYLHCTWIAQTEMDRASRLYPGLRMKLNHFNKNYDSSTKEFGDEEQVPIRPEWITVDRIINKRQIGDKVEYLVKWKELGYDEATWELKKDIHAFQSQIQKYESLMAKGTRKVFSRRRGAAYDAKLQKKFAPFEETPSFLGDGVLHPYQLEGLNFLRFAWQQEKHVILADEMGLGKTIQTIAFLASLGNEGVNGPHLVVAPLSTLRNWEREFATWTPHIHIVVYTGNAKARSIIREFEFYYPKPKDHQKVRRRDKKISKQDRIKFDVLLTSYEMVTCDAALLKSIRWECLVVDEGHRLKSKESKLFQALQNYSTHHRLLLTGTPLQNNLDELFNLMHFLDASKFSSLEDFQQEFRDINQEEQVRRLHQMLGSHLLRRVKKDVLKQLPPKKELMLRVDLSSLQKEYYKAILTRNYEALSRRMGGPQVSLNNVVMELRKLCGHPYMIGIEPDRKNGEDENRQRIEASGKLSLLDKMMVKLKARGHRVLIYSQFQRMLDILEDYLMSKKWSYERIDGSITGSERQIRIDRFNAPESNRFCFLLSTRAGGLGINLATADTVIIYDSDWNPHADLQAMARAHRLGQKNMVMIYRLVTRCSIEERMMQMTKKKMVLEHLVVGRMKTQVLNQEELDDILRYGAKSVFADENDESAKAWQIHYDDAAIDRLLDRSEVQTGHEMPVDDEDNDLLKAFKVANFGYINNEMGKKQEAEREAEADYEAEHLSSSQRMQYWENLLRERYEKQQQEAVQEMGKGKRSRKQINLGEDELAGMDYSSSEDEDEDDMNYEEAAKEKTKKIKVESSEHPALMEGDGKSLTILGFQRKHRARFVRVLMRFGLGDFSWSGFVPYFKQKGIEEIKEYGTLFLSHISEDMTDSPTFADGVPKEGLRIQDVLVRVAVLHLITNKIKQYVQSPTRMLFSSTVYGKYPALRSTSVWREDHDKFLLEAIIKHGYGRWLDIIEDTQYGLQYVVREELRLPAPGILKAPEVVLNGHTQDGADQVGDEAQHSMKKVVDFVKKRVSLLERVLNAEYQLDEQTPVESPMEETPQNNGTVKHQHQHQHQQHQQQQHEEEPRNLSGAQTNTSYGAPFPTPLAPEEVSAAALDNDPKRHDIARMYNEMCTILSDNRLDAFQTYAGNKSAGVRLRKSIRQLDGLCTDMRKGLAAKSDTPEPMERDDASDDNNNNNGKKEPVLAVDE